MKWEKILFKMVFYYEDDFVYTPDNVAYRFGCICCTLYDK